MADYGLLPPEINSGLIYAGPGAGSLLAAASAWSGLAADLQEAASGHRSVITALTSGPWLGPAAASLTASVSPFLAWLDNSAEQAAEAASQATAAVTAYETAFAASVPPPLIAANRALLQELIASNLLGQNSSAISTLEAQYAEFWAQDSGAMYSYAGSAAAATKLAELPAPAEVVDPYGLADQAIAVFKAQYNSGYTNVMNVASQVNPRVSDVLKTLSSPINGTAIDQFLVANTPLDDVVSLYSKYLSPYVNSLAAMIQSTQSFGQVSNGLTAMANFAKPAAAAAKAAEGAASAAGAAAAGAGQSAAGAAGSLGGVAAGLGKAIPIGGLSAPANWVPWHATTNPGIASAIPAAAESNSFPMAPPFGQFFNGGYGRNQPTYGFKPSVMAKPPAAG
ncbi:MULTISPECIES: PPE family protein [unclassified Mycobacterium]|uniref:PPE family protein n=1 Tax=unclassified Mycobacterium TaxID=2642494 RepID=UPI0026D8ABB9|nr:MULTISPECIES: PPE family protein [unclassified Mycobacterium]MDP7701760.1 PPE family protein [Mycobacterium sp. TY815]MDP7724595.1 PPE family protein [Mycobacterium sp. TY814]